MIRDLSAAGACAEQADVVVIGAGTVGLVVATRLARRGLRVICLESGGRQQTADEHPLNAVLHRRAIYAGAAHGRFRCLGGTSTRWGGALIPFLGADLRNTGWPLAMDELSPYLAEVEALFGLPDGPYELAPLVGDPTRPHVARLAKWPAFRRRNVYNLLAGEVGRSANLTVWLNATATTFRVADGRLQDVVAEAADGSRLTIRAREVLICAGAIESTRLLLALDRQNGGCLRTRSDALGRYFHDHLSVPFATLSVREPAALNREVGFRFGPGGTMRNLRFELGEGNPDRRTVPPCFAHVAFVAPPGSGFDALRDLFRHLQRRERPPWATVGRLLKATPWLARVAWWRAVERRLLYPDDATIEVHMVIEQAPLAENRITLADDHTDRFGLPLAAIDWSVGAADVAALWRAVASFEASWSASPLARMASLDRLPAEAVEAALQVGGGIYHPGGSTRMSADPAEGVVDRDLRLHEVPNTRVVATSVLPTGGGANPTMMLLLLGLRCADQVVAALAEPAGRPAPAVG